MLVFIIKSFEQLLWAIDKGVQLSKIRFIWIVCIESHNISKVLFINDPKARVQVVGILMINVYILCMILECWLWAGC